MHELEQHTGAQVGSHTEARIDPEMQHSESLVGRTDKNCDPDGPALIGNGKQGLHAGNIANPDPQAAVLFIDLRYAVGIDRLLDAVSYTMLVYIEKKQLLQGWTLRRS